VFEKGLFSGVDASHGLVASKSYLHREDKERNDKMSTYLPE
jgi:hypothetical protein